MKPNRWPIAPINLQYESASDQAALYFFPEPQREDRGQVQQVMYAKMPETQSRESGFFLTALYIHL